MTKLIAIGSGKGGTGKTFVATTLAAALAHMGERILLCDADLGLSNAAVQLGLEHGGDLSGLLLNRAVLAEAVAKVGGGAGARGGFDLLAAPSGSGALADADEQVADKLVARLRAARSYDRVILDLSAGVDATTMAFAVRADEILLVLTADPTALTDAYAFMKVLFRLGGCDVFALINMAESEAEGRRTGEALIRTCSVFLKSAPQYAGAIPRDGHAISAVRQQRSLLSLYPQAPAALAVEKLARSFAGPGPGGTLRANSASLR